MLSTGGFHSSLARCLRQMRDHFEQRGIEVHTADLLTRSNDRCPKIYVSFGWLRDYKRLCRRADVIPSALIITESPVVEPRLYKRVGRAAIHFRRLYSCSDDARLERFFGSQMTTIPFRWPIDFSGVEEKLWQRGARSLLVMINMNKLPSIYWNELFTERMRAVEFFSSYDEIDLYGVGWSQPSARMGTSHMPRVLQKLRNAVAVHRDRLRPPRLLAAARKVYRGQLEQKWDTLASYKFALCFENIVLKGWITEKIFECFRVGTIPVYWGATDVEQLIPDECFIDMRRFKNYEELRMFLHSLTEEEIEAYRRNAKSFLESSRFRLFGAEAFIELFESFLREDVPEANTA